MKVDDEKKAKVLIIILNYGTYELTIGLINQIRMKLSYPNYKILVIDNCSPNNSSAELQKQSGVLDYLFIDNERNSGYAAGNNIGIRYAIENGFEYSWILNNDVELQDESILEHMLSIMQLDSQIACVGPKILSSNGTTCAPFVNRPSLWSMTLGVLAERKQREKYRDSSLRVYRLYGCCMLLNNQIMEQIDCMDERTFLYCEEDILSERLLVNGYYCFYDSKVSVIHKGSESVKQMSKNRKATKIRETKRSFDLYLKEYRKYPWVARWLCETTRSFIIRIR